MIMIIMIMAPPPAEVSTSSVPGGVYRFPAGRACLAWLGDHQVHGFEGSEPVIITNRSVMTHLREHPPLC